jgi:glutamate N-acetyltransferase/amino-acid N-acetyltransferase
MGTLVATLRMEEESSGVTTPLGWAAGALHAGVKRRRPDLALLWSERPCTVAGVFTQNLVRSPVVDVTEVQVRSQVPVRALLVVSGNANACTGEEGYQDTLHVRALTAQYLGLAPNEVMVSATGIIGRRWPLERIAQGLAKLPRLISASGAHLFHKAILTTDHKEKSFSATLELGEGTVRLGAAAKGSGMIHPNMATTLAFVTTDAAVSAPDLQALLAEATEDTFNAISVDGDTSTNDMILVFANGASGVALAPGQEGWEAFASLLHEALGHLAREVVADGEGATMRLRVEVEGARTKAEAQLAARTVASSNLVKTAMHGLDPNWGRIAAALGRSGASLAPKELTIAIDGHTYYAAGRVLPGPERLTAKEEICIRCHLGVGQATAVAYGCDLSAEYVHINSRYHT